MTDFFYYSKIENIIEDKLTFAEYRIYKAIRDLVNKVDSNVVYPTIDYIIKHTEYKSKSYISQALAKLVNKGLLVRELVQSNKSKHKVYQYYVIRNLKLTKLFQELPEEEQKKYICCIEDEKPEIIFSDEEKELCIFINCQIGTSLTFDKARLLMDVARENIDIKSGNEMQTIMDIIIQKIDYISRPNVINKFGYIKKIIQEYSLQPKSSYIPQPDNKKKKKNGNDKNELTIDDLTADERKLYDACNKMKVTLELSQIQALMYWAKMLDLTLNNVIGVISNVIKISGIYDIYAYIRRSIFNYAKNPKKPKKKAYQYETEQSYDINEFESFAVTHSKNAKAVLSFETAEKPEHSEPQEETQPELNEHSEIQEETEIKPETQEEIKNAAIVSPPTRADIEAFFRDCRETIQHLKGK